MKKLIFNLLLINVLVINIANAQSVLLSENFDKLTAGAGQQLPIDWVARNANKDFAIWDIIANNPNNKTNAYSAPNAGVMSFGINGNDDYLISPKVNMKKGVAYKVKFQLKAIAAGTSFEKLAVHVSSDTTIAYLSTADAIYNDEMIVNTTFDNIEFVFKPTIDGQYALVFRSFSDPIEFLTIIDDIQIISPTTATENAETIDVSMSPNPAKDVLTVKSNTIIKSISIVTIEGKKVFESKPNQTQFDVNTSALPKCAYLIRLESIDNQTFTKKIIVE